VHFPWFSTVDTPSHLRRRQTVRQRPGPRL
jgi:hypothetical protein